MIVLVQANVLTIGINGRSEALRQLPVRLISVNTGIEAAGCLRRETISSVISKWDLDDMPGGQFLRGLKAIKPKIPTIVFIRSGDIKQEISARSLGVSAVMTDEADDDYFRQTVASVLGLDSIVSINSISAAKKENSDFAEVRK